MLDDDLDADHDEHNGRARIVAARPLHRHPSLDKLAASDRSRRENRPGQRRLRADNHINYKGKTISARGPATGLFIFCQ